MLKGSLTDGRQACELDQAPYPGKH